mgnify:CR=1 FL=1
MRKFNVPFGEVGAKIEIRLSNQTKMMLVCTTIMNIVMCLMSYGGKINVHTVCKQDSTFFCFKSIVKV